MPVPKTEGSMTRGEDGLVWEMEWQEQEAAGIQERLVLRKRTFVVLSELQEQPGNDATSGEARRQLLEDSSQDQRLTASILPSWVPKAWLPLPCPLLPPGAGGLAVISSPDPETGKRAAGSFLHFEELHPCEGQNTDKGANPGGE